MPLIEQLDGTGPIFERDQLLGEVRYHVRVYRAAQETPDQLNGAMARIEGFLSAASGSTFDPFDVWQRGAELVLRLEDGRTLECSVSSSAGALMATSRLKPLMTAVSRKNPQCVRVRRQDLAEHPVQDQRERQSLRPQAVVWRTDVRAKDLTPARRARDAAHLLTEAEMPMDIRALARLGAQTRVAELVAETDALLDAFPDLRRAAPRVANGTAETGASGRKLGFQISAATNARLKASRAKRKAMDSKVGFADQRVATTSNAGTLVAAKKRTKSPKGRARMSAAPKKRWAAQRRRAKKP